MKSEVSAKYTIAVHNTGVRLNKIQMIKIQTIKYEYSFEIYTIGIQMYCCNTTEIIGDKG